jgi:preprotein translocase subunit SecE
MEDSAKKNTPGFFSGVKAEFGKITWPDKKTTFKQSVAVVLISVVLGVIIAVLDFGAQNGVNFLTGL